MIMDPRTKEEQQAAAKECYEKILARGRRSCAGCHMDAYCPMVEATSRWLFETFLPAIDPSGSLRRGV